jgi:hypothetical protein
MTEYTLSRIDKSGGTAKHELVMALPELLNTGLPNVETLETLLSVQLARAKEGNEV